MSSLTTPLQTPLNAPYWEALDQGRLLFQECDAGHRWLPPRAHCPSCLSDRLAWVPAAGGASVVSWVVYHRSYDPAFDARVPYNVALVALDEGPRLLSNVVAVEAPGALVPGMRLRLRVEHDGGVALARFEPA